MLPSLEQAWLSSEMPCLLFLMTMPVEEESVWGEEEEGVEEEEEVVEGVEGVEEEGEVLVAEEEDGAQVEGEGLHPRPLRILCQNHEKCGLVESAFTLM